MAEAAAITILWLEERSVTTSYFASYSRGWARYQWGSVRWEERTVQPDFTPVFNRGRQFADRLAPHTLPLP